MRSSEISIHNSRFLNFKYNVSYFSQLFKYAFSKGIDLLARVKHVARLVTGFSFAVVVFCGLVMFLYFAVSN